MTQSALQIATPPINAKPLQLITKIFAESVITTIKTQCSYQLTAGKPFIAGDGAPTIANASIGATLTLNGKQFSGTVTIAYDAQIFLALIGAMFGQKFEQLDAELEDGAGKLLNMIFGTAKSRFETDHKFSFAAAIPTIVRGDHLLMRSPASQLQIGVPFKGPDGTLEMRVS